MTDASNDAEPPTAPPRTSAAEIIAAFDSVPMDFTGSGGAWRYGGGRDLSRLEMDARTDPAG